MSKTFLLIILSLFCILLFGCVDNKQQEYRIQICHENDGVMSEYSNCIIGMERYEFREAEGKEVLVKISISKSEAENSALIGGIIGGMIGSSSSK